MRRLTYPQERLLFRIGAAGRKGLPLTTAIEVRVARGLMHKRLVRLEHEGAVTRAWVE